MKRAITIVGLALAFAAPAQAHSALTFQRARAAIVKDWHRIDKVQSVHCRRFNALSMDCRFTLAPTTLFVGSGTPTLCSGREWVKLRSNGLHLLAHGGLVCVDQTAANTSHLHWDTR